MSAMLTVVAILALIVAGSAAEYRDSQRRDRARQLQAARDRIRALHPDQVTRRLAGIAHASAAAEAGRHPSTPPDDDPYVIPW